MRASSRGRPRGMEFGVGIAAASSSERPAGTRRGPAPRPAFVGPPWPGRGSPAVLVRDRAAAAGEARARPQPPCLSVGSRTQGGTSGGVGDRRTGRGGSGLRLGAGSVCGEAGRCLNGLREPQVLVTASEDPLTAGDARPNTPVYAYSASPAPQRGGGSSQEELSTPSTCVLQPLAFSVFEISIMKVEFCCEFVFTLFFLAHPSGKIAAEILGLAHC